MTLLHLGLVLAVLVSAARGVKRSGCNSSIIDTLPREVERDIFAVGEHLSDADLAAVSQTSRAFQEKTQEERAYRAVQKRYVALFGTFAWNATFSGRKRDAEAVQVAEHHLRLAYSLDGSEANPDDDMSMLRFAHYDALMRSGFAKGDLGQRLPARFWELFNFVMRTRLPPPAQLDSMSGFLRYFAKAFSPDVADRDGVNRYKLATYEFAIVFSEYLAAWLVVRRDDASVFESPVASFVAVLRLFAGDHDPRELKRAARSALDNTLSQMDGADAMLVRRKYRLLWDHADVWFAVLDELSLSKVK